MLMLSRSSWRWPLRLLWRSTLVGSKCDGVLVILDCDLVSDFRFRDCGEDLLLDISEVLFNELTFFKLMEDFKGCVM